MALQDQFDTYVKLYNVKSSNENIKNFTIYGERHSGTNWLEKIITNKFQIPITWEYGHKHFFGFQPFDKLNKANNTLFISIVRNIYDWVSAMQKKPYHIYIDKKNHIVNVKNIISKKLNIPIEHDKNIYTKEIYKDIFELRSTKLHYLYYDLPFYINNYLIIRYEDLIINYDLITKIIAENFNLDPNPNYQILSDKSKLQPYQIKSEIFNMIKLKTNWKYENLLCYKEKYSMLDSRVPCY